jgi:hypothetical protein
VRRFREILTVLPLGNTLNDGAYGARSMAIEHSVSLALKMAASYVSGMKFATIVQRNQQSCDKG